MAFGQRRRPLMAATRAEPEPVDSDLVTGWIVTGWIVRGARLRLPFLFWLSNGLCSRPCPRNRPKKGRKGWWRTKKPDGENDGFCLGRKLQGGHMQMNNVLREWGGQSNTPS